MYYNDSIFHVELEKIRPNPFQPRREFDQAKLHELAESLRQYGVLQPLVVTRKEVSKEDGGLSTEYELIAGERRLRAAKIAGLFQIPVVIRDKEDDDKAKLEIAIIENLQREDLNVVDRAMAFKRLADEFGFKHSQIAKKVGKSREYVSNTMRVLALNQNVLDALSTGKISEGHARPLMMLADRPEEQETLFREIQLKKMTVRDAERVARRIAYDRVRKKALDPEMVELEERFTEKLGTRVRIDKKEVGGKLTIDFFSDTDLQSLYDAFHEIKQEDAERKQQQEAGTYLGETNSDMSEMTKEADAVTESGYEDFSDYGELPEEGDTNTSGSSGQQQHTYQSTPENQDTKISENHLSTDAHSEVPNTDTTESNETDAEPKEGKKESTTDEDSLYSVRNFSI